MRDCDCGGASADWSRSPNNYDFVSAIAEHVRNQVPAAGGRPPTVMIICGTGLNGLADEMEDSAHVDYKDIPGFAVGTVEGHKGRLVFGTLEGKSVMCMQGRVHPYEGHSLAQCALPVRLGRLLGAATLIITSAVGGINGELLRLGDLMLLRDHMFVPGLALRGPLVGRNDERFGPRFPSSTDIYDKGLRAVARRAAAEAGGRQLKEGVYAMVGGPQFETPAEIRWLRAAGCDVVGMSVCHEAVVARHCGLRVLALALVTNLSETDSDAPKQGLLHEDVLRAGAAAAEDTARLVRAVVGRLE